MDPNVREVVRCLKGLFSVFGDMVLEVYHLNNILGVCVFIAAVIIFWKISLKDYWKMLLLLGPTTVIGGILLNLFVKNDVYVAFAIAGILFLGIIAFYSSDLYKHEHRNISRAPWTEEDERLVKPFNDASIWILYLAFYLVVAGVKLKFFTILAQKINLM